MGRVRYLMYTARERSALPDLPNAVDRGAFLKIEDVW